ncbi:alpha/beta hydrolase [Microbacterium sp. JZ70]
MIDAAAPEWLRRALAVRPEQRAVEVEGATVRYRAWGPVGAPGLVLVHGGLAHARWWDHIAPLLGRHRVLAPDLTGHGDSTWRDEYDTTQWAREIAAVIRDDGLTRPVVVGHSMGGLPAVTAALDMGDALSGVATIDVRFNDGEWPAREKPSDRFASLEDGIARFAPIASRVGIEVDPAIQRHVAATSLTWDGDAWRWKRADSYGIRRVPLRRLLPDVRVPLAIIRTDHGLVTPEAAIEMQQLIPAPSVVTTVPEAGHNPMLEQPLALVGVLRALLDGWWPTPSSTSGRPSDAGRSNTE